MENNEILYYKTNGNIYGLCEHKHPTPTEANQCDFAIERADTEYRYIIPIYKKNVENLYLLGDGEYESFTSNCTSILYARNCFLYSIWRFRKHILEDLNNSCFSIFESLYPNIKFTLDKALPESYVNTNNWYWQNLELVATGSNTINENFVSLYKALKEWMVRNKLEWTGNWLLDQALQTLIFWCQKSQDQHSKARKDFLWRGYSIGSLNVFSPQELAFSFQDIGWDSTQHKEKVYREQIQQKFLAALDEYIKGIHSLSIERKLQKIQPKERETEKYFYWLAQNKILDSTGKKRSLKTIARHEEKDKSTIPKGIKEALLLLHIEQATNTN